MLNIVSLHLNNRGTIRLEQGELHLLEHCIVRKIEEQLEIKNLNYEGIVFNAEVFIDAAFVEIMYSDSQLTNTLNDIITNIKFYDIDKSVIECELKILKSESELNDLTDEDKYLYEGLKEITGFTLDDLNKTEHIEVTDNLISKFNNHINNAVRVTFSDKYLLHYRYISTRFK